MTEKLDALVAVYHSNKDLENGLQRLRNWGFSMSRVSVAGKGYVNEERLVGCYLASQRMRHFGQIGTFWDEYWGLLSGAGFFSVPGLGPILAAGPLVSWIVTALSVPGAERDPSVVAAGLAGVGISREAADAYGLALKSSHFLLLVHGAVEEVTNARELLHNTAAHRLDVYSKTITPPAGASHFFG